jgi:DNA-binding NarL/FixJ family response regulator
MRMAIAVGPSTTRVPRTRCSQPWGAEPYRQAVADDLASCGIRTSTKRSPLDFTEREQDVVVLVRMGMTNKEIAQQMYVSEKAVEYHLRNVDGKLGISSRRELRLQR